MKLKLDDRTNKRDASILTVSERVEAHEVEVLKAGLTKLLSEGRHLALDYSSAEISPDAKASFGRLVSWFEAAKLEALEKKIAARIAAIRQEKAGLEARLASTATLGQEIRKARRRYWELRISSRKLEVELAAEGAPRRDPLAPSPRALELEALVRKIFFAPLGLKGQAS
jgi:hypothetical protein